LNDDPAFFVSVNGLLERIVDRIVCVDTDDGGTQTMGGHRRWEDTDDGRTQTMVGRRLYLIVILVKPG
jgi:hypothetical protein